MKARLSLLLAALVLSATSAQAEDREWVSYRTLMEKMHLAGIPALPAGEHDKVSLYMVVNTDKSVKPADIVFTVAGPGGKESFSPDAQRHLYLPLRQKWLDDGSTILINRPKGEKVGLGIGMDAVMPAGTEWPYAFLLGSVDQCNALIKSQAGVLSMFMPKLKSVTLKFAKPAQLTIASKSGTRSLATDAKFSIRLKPDETLMKENPRIVLSERPTAAELDTE